MGCAQRRFGPFNLGGYGYFSSLINGCNLIISQFLITKLHFHFGFQSFPFLFFIFSLTNYILFYPFFIVDIYLSLIILIYLSGLSIVFIIVSSFSGYGKYSMLGCIRIISQ
jgi:NADH:ubiquinone oxidoreductase subunit H